MPVTAAEPMQTGDPPVRVLSWLPHIPKCYDRLTPATLHTPPEAPVPGPSQCTGPSRDSPPQATNVTPGVSPSAIDPSSSNTMTMPTSVGVLEPPTSTPDESHPSSGVTKATPFTSPPYSLKRDASTQTTGVVSTIPFPSMSSAPKRRGTFLDPNDYLPVRRSTNGPLFSQLQAGVSSSLASSRAIKPLPSSKGFVLGKIDSSSIARRLSSSSTNGKRKGNTRVREPENEVGQVESRPAQRPKNGDGFQNLNPERFQAWKDAVLQVLGQQPSNPAGG